MRCLPPAAIRMLLQGPQSDQLRVGIYDFIEFDCSVCAGLGNGRSVGAKKQDQETQTEWQPMVATKSSSAR